MGSAGAAVGVGSDAMAVLDGEHPAPAAPSNAMTTMAAICRSDLLSFIFLGTLGRRPPPAGPSPPISSRNGVSLSWGATAVLGRSGRRPQARSSRRRQGPPLRSPLLFHLLACRMPSKTLPPLHFTKPAVRDL